MREYIFRGKTEDGEWVYGYVDATAYKDLVVIHTDATTYKVLPDTVGQYTGLDDANGDEIYEGDLLKSAFSKNVFGVVTWNEKGYFCIIPISILKDKYRSDNDFATLGYMLEKKIDGRSCEFTVIGNIHDNPKITEI